MSCTCFLKNTHQVPTHGLDPSQFYGSGFVVKNWENMFVEEMLIYSDLEYGKLAPAPVYNNI
jgi:hypothetical protein